LTRYRFRNEENEKAKAQATKHASHPLSARERADTTELIEAKVIRIDQSGKFCKIECKYVRESQQGPSFLGISTISTPTQLAQMYILVC
jgi:hypothetical protein